MRKRILELLRNSKGTPVSGEEISKELEVSRTAIWKHIQALKSEGYEIESVPKRGYILREVPDRLFPQEILSRLQTKWLGRKLVGILTEMNAEFGHINYVVIGTGINTNASPEDYPEEVRDLAVSVADAATEPFTRVELLCDILKNMEDLYETAVQEGFDPVFDEWRRYSCTLGQEVKVIAPDMTYFGTAEDIDEEGLLIVRREDGSKEKVVAGDVSIRPAKAKGNEYA